MATSSQGVAQRLRAAFVTGLIAILPFLLTLFILTWIAGIVNGYIGPRTVLGGVLHTIGYQFTPASNWWLAYLIGIGLVVGSILLLGVLLESGFRKTMTNLVDRTVHRLPLVRAIYRTTDKIVSLVPSSDSEQLQGMRVVYCRFGGDENGVGTLALMPTPEIFRIGGRDHRIVLIPTAPVPVGGAMLFMPAESVFETTMSIDAFAGSYLSMGVATAPFEIGQALR